MAANPPSYPHDGTYADLLLWHLMVWWTRPGGNTTERGKRPWNINAFIGEALKDEGNSDPDGQSKKYRSWTGKYQKYPPSKGQSQAISNVLFGGEIQFKRWENDIELARIRSRGKGNNVATISVSSAIAEVERYISAAPVDSGCQTDVLDHASQLPFAHHQLHRFKAEPTNLNELLRTDLRATTLVGRVDELAMLSDGCLHRQPSP